MPSATFHPSRPFGAVSPISDTFGMTPFYRDAGEELVEAAFTALVDYSFHLGEPEDFTWEAARARRHELQELQAPQDIDAAVYRLKVLFGAGV